MLPSSGKEKEQDEPIEALARADGVHREVDGRQYVESDSDIGHVCRLVPCEGWNYSGGGVGRQWRGDRA